MRLRAALLGLALVAPLVACGGDDSSSSSSTSSGEGGQGGGAPVSPEIAQICSDYCACVACTPASEDGCPGLWDITHMNAAGAGCEPEYDALVDCLIATTSCEQMVPVDRCDGSRDALDTCIN